MNHLLRDLAPISDSTWRLLDEEATQRLTVALGARKLVDFSGPHGWAHPATNLGRATPLTKTASKQVSGLQRRVLPIVEVRADFQLALSELRDADRGADDPNLDALDTAAHEIAVAENIAVCHGWPGAFAGISEVSPHEPIPLGKAAERFVQPVATAIERLLNSGVNGPYALALGSEHYREVLATAEHGYPIVAHLRQVLDGPIVWTPGLNGAIVLSERGGDFRFDAGQDLSIGYDGHDAETVSMYLVESFSFHVSTPEAAVVLAP